MNLSKMLLICTLIGLVLFGSDSFAQEQEMGVIAQLEAVRHIPIGRDNFVIWEVIFNHNGISLIDYVVAYDQQFWAYPGDQIPLKLSDETGLYDIDSSQIQEVFSVQTLRDTLSRLQIIGQ